MRSLQLQFVPLCVLVSDLRITKESSPGPPVLAIRTVEALRNGRPPNPLKFLFIAATFVYLNYTVSVMERPLMGLVMFEAWHDVQYLAIVWLAASNSMP